MIQFFFGLCLAERNVHNVCFQQDGVTAYTSRTLLQRLKEMLTGRMICLRHAIPQSSSLQTLSKEYNTTEGGNPYGNFSNIARNVSKSYGKLQKSLATVLQQWWTALWRYIKNQLK